ncbi:MAG: DUF2807 domain-containing protein [Cruoricaptor ignavus]|nr:DUF2807 domain-containing protein [Cruoricaptor ignavus]
MKNIFTLLLSSFILISCGEISPKGEIASKYISIEDFSNLNLQGNFHVFYVASSKNNIGVETYKNIADNVEIKVKNNTLNVTEKRPTKDVDFYNITIYSKKSPENITISDDAELNISGEIKTEKLRLNLKNNAIFIGSINTQKTDIEMQNTSRANFSGITKFATIKISDTANIIAPYWFVDNLNLDSKNGNYTEVNVKDTLKGTLQNTAKLLYYNQPIQQLKADKTTKIENKPLQ